MMMKNEHLVPEVIIGIVKKLSAKDIHENEKWNLIVRLETIRDYCDQVLRSIKK